MQTAANPRSRTVAFALTVALAFGYMAVMQGQADAKPAPPTVLVADANASDVGGMCRHSASFLVDGAKGKWATFELQRSFNGGQWQPMTSDRSDIKTDPTITADLGFNGEVAFRVRLIKRDTPLTDWATAEATFCAP